MEMQQIIERRIVPVVVIDKAEDAVPLAEALLAGGLDVLEVTFRTAAAEAAVHAIAQKMPAILIGAGTILSPEQMDRAIGAGAKFGVAPGLNRRVVERARERKVPFVPGVMTPSEVELGLELGCTLQKFFPAAAAGGVAMLKAFAGPYAHTGVKFVPLGGISAANAADYFALPIVGAIGGTWIAERKLIAERKWAEITRNAKEIREIAARPVKG
jgi:2-dehydro-3-deoxyphosphogluconate aldolase / (4S)-4-hydroxy-2-oxoglutarate aldolase